MTVSDSRLCRGGQSLKDTSGEASAPLFATTPSLGISAGRVALGSAESVTNSFLRPALECTTRATSSLATALRMSRLSFWMIAGNDYLTPSKENDRALMQALDYAAQRGVIAVVAAGG